MWFRLRSRPLRTALRWQLIATAGLTLICAILAGLHGAVSAALGGLISVGAGAAFAALGSLAEGKPAGFALIHMLRAEAVKIGLMVVLLWLVLAAYAKAVVPALIASFLVTAVIFSMAALVRDE